MSDISAVNLMVGWWLFACSMNCVTWSLFIFQAPVVQKLDSAIHRINHYPVENAIGFPNTYPLDSDLSGGQPYPTFEQLGPDREYIINKPFPDEVVLERYGVGFVILPSP